jgi:hypothetical protein
LFKEPFFRDTIIKLDDEKIEDIMRKYKYFKYKEDSNEAIFGQDMFDESNMSYYVRKAFKKEYASHYCY